MKLKPSEIIIKDRIRQDNGDIESLVDSLGEDLQGSPITITKDKILIDGYRRLIAWKKQYNNEPIECFEYQGKTDKKMMEAKMLIMTKNPTPDEIYKAGQIAENIIEQQPKSKKMPDGHRNLYDEKVGKAAKMLGLSHRQYARTKSVMKPELKNEIGKEKDAEIKQIAREKSVRTAENRLKEIRIEKENAKNPKPKKEKPDINKIIQQNVIQNLVDINTVLDDILKNWDSVDETNQNEFKFHVSSFISKINKKFNQEVTSWKTQKLLK